MGCIGEAANENFHEIYAAVRARASLDVPVLVVLEDKLVLARASTQTEIAFTPPVVHVVKAVAHAPVAVFVASHPSVGQALVDPARILLTNLRAALAPLVAAVDALSAGSHRATVEDLSAVISATDMQLDRVLGEAVVDAKELARFASFLGPILLRCTEDATRIQLEALHHCVTHTVAGLDEADR